MDKLSFDTQMALPFQQMLKTEGHFNCRGNAMFFVDYPCAVIFRLGSRLGVL